MNKTLWRPKKSDIEKSWMQKFINFINKKYDMSISNYSSLYKWSITENEKFWNSVSDFFKIKYFSYPREIKKFKAVLIEVFCQWILPQIE